MSVKQLDDFFHCPKVGKEEFGVGLRRGGSPVEVYRDH